MDDIIEISAVKVKGGIVQDTFSTLVNPGRHIPAQATKVNGITDQMVSEAPLIREAMTEFLRFVGEDILVGHNIQSFDMKFIYREVEELFQETVSNDFIDTLYMEGRNTIWIHLCSLAFWKTFFRCNLDTDIKVLCITICLG